MNSERRHLAHVCIQLVKVGSLREEISDEAHDALVAAVKAMRQAETWSLRNQERHEGKNKTTDTSIAVSRVALPALERADSALAEGDYLQVIKQLRIAATTDGSEPVPKKRRRVK